jgi:uncharacterized membrane protein
VVRLPLEVYELVAAPLAFALAFRHAQKALGAGRAAVEMLALVLYGYALERVVIAVFASHEYVPAWRAAPGGVPVAVAVTWAAVIVSVMAQAARVGGASCFGRAGRAALFGIALDLLMEPVAAARGLWAWTPSGPWLGVPLGNFVGWGVIVGVYTFGAERFGDAASLGAQALRRAALGAAAVGALVVVGVAWRSLRAERLFEGGRGAVVAGALFAGAVLSARPKAARIAGPGLAARLGRARGPLPAVVPLLLAALFAADAFLGGPPALWPVASVALVALGGAAIGTSSGGSPAPSPSG